MCYHRSIGSHPSAPKSEVIGMEKLKSELLQIIERMDEYQLRLVLSFIKTLFS